VIGNPTLTRFGYMISLLRGLGLVARSSPVVRPHKGVSDVRNSEVAIPSQD
jgi:hypothetical protein